MINDRCSFQVTTSLERQMAVATPHGGVESPGAIELLAALEDAIDHLYSESEHRPDG
jgi:hypothetical protein